MSLRVRDGMCKGPLPSEAQADADMGSSGAVTTAKDGSD